MLPHSRRDVAERPAGLRMRSFRSFARPSGSYLPIVGVCAVLLSLTVPSLGDRSLWLDEATSVDLAGRSWGNLLSAIQSDKVNMSLYFVLLKIWRVFGDSEAAVRSLSTVFAVATVPILYRLLTIVSGHRAAVVGIVFYALNSFVVAYAQEARGYSLAMLLVTSSTLLYMKATDTPTWKGWVGFGLVSGVSLYAHTFAALVTLAQLAVLPAIMRRSSWGLVLLGGLTWLVVAAPYLLLAARQSTGVLEWIPPPSPLGLREMLIGLAGSEGTLAIYLVGTVIAIAVAGRGDGRPGASKVLITAAWLLVPIVAAFALSHVRPILVTRYLGVVVPAMVALTAVGLSRLPTRAAGALVLMLSIISSGSMIKSQMAPNAAQWREVTVFLGNHATSEDAVLLWKGENVKPLQYYVLRLGLESRVEVLSPADVKGQATVWLIGGARLPVAGDSRASTISQVLSGNYEQTGRWWFGDLRVRRFELNPS